ncbi:MAG: CBS domain-containing protein, partial [bacterium]
MTKNPDCVSPDMTLLDAMREMHDQKYLHLPVRDEAGVVLGLVDVMELVCHTAGGDKGAGKGWRDFFNNAMNARGDDEGSETSSLHSGRASTTRPKGQSAGGSVKAIGSVENSVVTQQRPVSKLRPKAPLTVSDRVSIVEVCELMASKRVDAALLVNSRGELSGILTDNDVTRRVISKFIDIKSAAKGVMTKQPKCVSSEDPALDALEMMVENRFRHLPVLDKSGAVVGLLDIAKCLYDAISALEKVQTQEGDTSASTEMLAGLMTGA